MITAADRREWRSQAQSGGGWVRQEANQPRPDAPIQHLQSFTPPRATAGVLWDSWGFSSLTLSVIDSDLR